VAGPTAAPPPFTRRNDFREVMHGVELVDPYQWLEDGEAIETRDWIAAQNAYAHSMLDGLPSRERAMNRLHEMLWHDSVGSPLERNGYYFFMKRRADEDQWSIFRRKGMDGPDELIVDPHPLSAEHTASVFIHSATHDASMLIYGVRQGGVDETEIRVLDLKNCRDLSDRIPLALLGGVEWKRDGSGFYYTINHRDKGPRIYFHFLGTESNTDREIFGEGFGPGTWTSAFESEDGRYLMIVVQWGWQKTEWYFRDLAEDGPVRPLITGIDAMSYCAFAGDYAIARTHWNASNGRILKIDLNDPERESWREIVPQSEDAIQGFALIGQKLFVNYLHDVTSRIAIFSLDGEPLGDLPLPFAGTAQIYGRHGHDQGIFYITSYTTPQSTYIYQASSGERTLWYRDAVPFESDQFEMNQVWYSSKDGTRVPMFVVHRKDLVLDGRRPTVLYGYGGFNISLAPNFGPASAWWMEQGGVYAVPSLRGGGEFGETWHSAGMLENKQNVFDDFIGAAEWLIANGYTSPGNLAITGGSNGGLLVGAVTTQRPDLMRAVICRHPDLDMIRFRRYSKNNNPPALLEYGDPADSEQFNFIFAYSPYERVEKGEKYPAVLFTTGEADTRVPPAQARKMTARMQAATASSLPILLLHATTDGHAGGKPFSRMIEDASLEWAFLAWQLGLESAERRNEIQ
jgi:prolyl oligopeptidase